MPCTYNMFPEYHTQANYRQFGLLYFKLLHFLLSVAPCESLHVLRERNLDILFRLLTCRYHLLVECNESIKDRKEWNEMLYHNELGFNSLVRVDIVLCERSWLSRCYCRRQLSQRPWSTDSPQELHESWQTTISGTLSMLLSPRFLQRCLETTWKIISTLIVY